MGSFDSSQYRRNPYLYIKRNRTNQTSFNDIKFNSDIVHEDNGARNVYINPAVMKGLAKSSIDYKNGTEKSSTTVLINPNFKSQVFLNPEFSRNNISMKGNIYVNPKVVHANNAVIKCEKNELQVSEGFDIKSGVSDKSKVVLSTKNKLIRMPTTQAERKTDNSPLVTRRSANVVHSKYKLVKVESKMYNVKNQQALGKATENIKSNKSFAQRSVQSRFRDVKSDKNEGGLVVKRHNIIHTKYKIVHSTNENLSRTERKRRSSLRTKYKIVKFHSFEKENTINSLSSRSRTVSNHNKSKKKFIYVDRFLSMSCIAKNMLVKQNTSFRKSEFVNINGILYRKSHNSLKKTSVAYQSCGINKLPHKSLYKLINKRLSNNSKEDKCSVRRVTALKRASFSKLRKNNIPCPIFRKYGKCSRKEKGKCIKSHNPNQIALCIKFLQGACTNENCLLSHEVSAEKMPTCKFYLEGTCSKEDCPYLHVKISPKADICKDFLQGFCKKAAECDKRHQFLCPDFEKNGSCPRRRCQYPHGKVVRKNSKLIFKKVAKKCSKKSIDTTNVQKLDINVEGNSEFGKTVKVRYYEEKNDCENNVGKADNNDENDPAGKQVLGCNMSLKCRPNVGVLPSYIPFGEKS